MSAGELSDYSACVVLQVKGEIAYVLDVVRERLDYPDLRRKIIEVHRRWKNYTNSYALVIEDKGSGMSLIQDLKREGIHAIPEKPIMDKVMRMNAQLARIEAGCVHVPRRAAWSGRVPQVSSWPFRRQNMMIRSTRSPKAWIERLATETSCTAALSRGCVRR